MGRPIRNTNPEYVRHITCRTLNAQLLLVPSKELNNIVAGVVAKYQQKFSISIYAISLLGNHYHILAKAPKRNLWRFEQAINSEIAKRVNIFRNRRGFFWERRYDEQICPAREDSFEALLYVLCNPVNHGLVRSPKEWPGFSSYEQMLDGKERTYPVVNYTAYNKAKRIAAKTGEKIRIADYTDWFSLKISRLPGYKHLSQEEWVNLLESSLLERCEQIAKERKQNNQGFLGRIQVLSQSPLSHPRKVKRHPRPVCYSKCLETKKQFKDWFKPWMQAYQAASIKFRNLLFSTTFPPDSLFPPMHYSTA